MSYVESPVETVKKFSRTSGWKKASHEELTSDFLSLGSESNWQWDQYVFEEKDGKLYDPRRKRVISGTGNGDEVEEGINSQLERWFLTHESGIAVWISPRSASRLYPDDKLAIHRIAYEITGKKVLLCASHPFRTNFRNPEEIRRFIFAEDDNEESVFEIINWLNKASQKRVETDAPDLTERKKQAEYFAFQYRSGVPIDRIVFEMTQTKFLGENPIGCGSSATTTQSSPFHESSPVFNVNYEGWHGGTCRICGTSTWVGPCDICAPCASKM